MEALNKALDEDSLVSHLTPKRKSEIEASAKVTINSPKTKITTRLPKYDLARLKASALAQGIPYQTLLSSIIHRYVEGQLIDK